MATTTGEPKKYGIMVKLAACSLLCVQMTQALANPSLAGIMADFPDVPVTTVQTVINIATLVMIVSALIAPPLAKKLGYKTAGLIAMGICLIGGVLPGFVHPSVEVIIIERGFFGIGYGMVYTLGIAACGEFWRGKETSQMVGMVTFACGLAGIVYNLIAAWAAPFGWTYVYYTFFLIIVFMVFYAIFMPQRAELPDVQAVPAEKKKFTLSGLGKNFWIFIIAMVLGIASVAAFMNNIAMIVVGTGIDATGAAVGIIMTGFGAGLMLGGGVYPFAYRLLKRAALPVFLLIDTVAFIIIMLNPTYITLIVLATIIGIMFGALNAEFGDMANKKVEDYPNASAVGSSIFIAAAGLAQFISPFLLSGLAGIFGLTEANVFYQYYPAIVIIGVGGVFLLVMAIIKKNKVDYEHDEIAAPEA